MARSVSAVSLACFNSLFIALIAPPGLGLVGLSGEHAISCRRGANVLVIRGSSAAPSRAVLLLLAARTKLPS